MKRLLLASLLLVGLVAGSVWNERLAIAQETPGPVARGSGDANGDGRVDIGDAIYLVNYLFSGGPGPLPCAAETATADLAAEWWQWLRSIPRSIHPIDQEGEIDCGIQQMGPVWFLAGSRNRPEGPMVRSCAIPRDTPLFFPLVTTMFFNDPDENLTVEEKREVLNEIATQGCNLECLVDGVPTAFSTPIERVQSPPFRLFFGEDDVFGRPAGQGDEESIAEGFWVRLPPLEPGEHELRFSGSFCNPETKLPRFTASVVYHLTVE